MREAPPGSRTGVLRPPVLILSRRRSLICALPPDDRSLAVAALGSFALVRLPAGAELDAADISGVAAEPAEVADRGRPQRGGTLDRRQGSAVGRGRAGPFNAAKLMAGRGPARLLVPCWFMSEQTSINPFAPGHGVLPPCLAGRDVEQRELTRLLAYLRGGRGAPRAAVLSGPRGNGKTVLLRWFQQEIEADGRIDAVWRTPSDLPDLDALATALVPPNRFRSLLPHNLSVSIGIGRLGWNLGGNPGTLTELLRLRCAHRPLVILLDEAHTLDVAVGRALLNTSQSTAATAPFLLVLAGTPGLGLHLDRMSATFWNRARHIGVDLLDDAAAATALERPFAEQNPAMSFDEAPLRRVLDESQRYPYFLQLWGAALWDAATQQKKTRIDETVAATAGRVFGPERSAYYEHRRDELERRDLLRAADAVADAFAARATLAQDELNAVIAGALGLDSTPETVQCRDRLTMLGYVWKPPGGGDRWRPGIPSLMRYLRSPGA